MKLLGIVLLFLMAVPAFAEDVPACSTDLSGVWVGTCANLPGPVHATVVQDGCAKVAFLIRFLNTDGATLLLRAFDVQVGTREIFTRHSGDYEEKITRPNSEWRDNGTSLWSKEVYEYTGSQASTVKGKFFLQGGKLNLDVEDNNGSGDCVLNRVL